MIHVYIFFRKLGEENTDKNISFKMSIVLSPRIKRLISYLPNFCVCVPHVG